MRPLFKTTSLSSAQALQLITVAHGAGNGRALGYETHIRQVAVCRGARQHRTFTVLAMAVTAGIAVDVAAVAAVGKLGITHHVHAVRTLQAVSGTIGAQRVDIGVTGVALDDRAGMTLQLVRRDVVVGVRVGVRPLSVGRTMTTFTHHTTVAGAHPVQLRIARTRVGEAVEAGRHRRFGKALVGRHDRRGLGIAGYGRPGADG